MPKSSPKKSLRHIFQSVNEIDEEVKVDSENSDLEDSPALNHIKKSGSKVQGILALTKENLKKLEMKNQVIFPSNL